MGHFMDVRQFEDDSQEPPPHKKRRALSKTEIQEIKQRKEQRKAEAKRR